MNAKRVGLLVATFSHEDPDTLRVTWNDQELARETVTFRVDLLGDLKQIVDAMYAHQLAAQAAHFAELAK